MEKKKSASRKNNKGELFLRAAQRNATQRRGRLCVMCDGLALIVAVALCSFVLVKENSFPSFSSSSS